MAGRQGGAHLISFGRTIAVGLNVATLASAAAGPVPTPKPVPALQKLQEAAQAGDATAMNQLASRYSSGAGFPEDSRKAFELFRKAAEAGNPPAMLNLALRYRRGDGVPKNEERANEWLQKAVTSLEAS